MKAQWAGKSLDEHTRDELIGIIIMQETTIKRLNDQLLKRELDHLHDIRDIALEKRSQSWLSRLLRNN